MPVANTPEEVKIQELFVEYINKAREVFPEGTHESTVDSEIAIMTYSLLDVFNRERS